MYPLYNFFFGGIVIRYQPVFIFVYMTKKKEWYTYLLYSTRVALGMSIYINLCTYIANLSPFPPFHPFSP